MWFISKTAAILIGCFDETKVGGLLAGKGKQVFKKGQKG